jgi:hypothetical protein
MTRLDYTAFWFAFGLIGTIVMLFISLPVQAALLLTFMGITLLALKAGAQ